MQTHSNGKLSSCVSEHIRSFLPILCLFHRSCASLGWLSPASIQTMPLVQSLGPSVPEDKHNRTTFEYWLGLVVLEESLEELSKILTFLKPWFSHQ